jgi:hypothetical protein
MFSSNLSFQSHFTLYIRIYLVTRCNSYRSSSLRIRFTFTQNTGNPSYQRKSQENLEIPSLSWSVDKSEKDASCSHHRNGLSSSKHISRCETRGCKISANSEPVQLMGYEKSILVSPGRPVEGDTLTLSKLSPHAGTFISNNCVLLLRCYA